MKLTERLRGVTWWRLLVLVGVAVIGFVLGRLVTIDLQSAGVWLSDAVHGALSDEAWRALLPVLGVLAGAWLTSRLALRRELGKDLRENLISAVFACLHAAHALSTAFDVFGRNAGLGGGKVRASGDPDAPWEIVDEEVASEADERAAGAFEDVITALAEMRKRNLELAVLAPPRLRESFEAIAQRVESYFQRAFQDDQIFLAAVHQECEDDLVGLVEAAIGESRGAVRSSRL